MILNEKDIVISALLWTTVTARSRPQTDFTSKPHAINIWSHRINGERKKNKANEIQLQTNSRFF